MNDHISHESSVTGVYSLQVCTHKVVSPILSQIQALKMPLAFSLFHLIEVVYYLIYGIIADCLCLSSSFYPLVAYTFSELASCF